MELNVYDNLLVEDSVGRDVAEFSLEMRLSALRAEYTRKGGCGKTAIGRIFALIIYLAGY